MNPEMKALSLWGPVAGWCALIFGLSAIPNLNSGLDCDYPLRKLAHMVEYGILYALVLRALGGTYGARRAWPWAAAAFSALYAMSDEWHQTFVPFRTGRWSDVGVDAVGILLVFFIKKY